MFAHIFTLTRFLLVRKQECILPRVGKYDLINLCEMSQDCLLKFIVLFGSTCCASLIHIHTTFSLFSFIIYIKKGYFIVQFKIP